MVLGTSRIEQDSEAALMSDGPLTEPQKLSREDANKGVGTLAIQ